MEEVNKDVTQTGPEGNGTDGVAGNGNPTDITLPTTAEELAALLQAEGDKRVASAIKKREEKLKTEFAQQLESEKAEAARLAKLSAAEREKEMFERQKAEFESQRVEFARTQLLNQTMLELQKAQLPVNFAEYMIGTDAEQTLEKINAFKLEWQTALQNAVDEKLKGRSPKAGGSDASIMTKEQFQKLGYKERVNLMTANPALYAELSK